MVLKGVYTQRLKRRTQPLVHAYIYTENVKFVILGRRTKWKQKARFKIIKEYKKQLAYMWHRQYDRMITW